MKAVRLESYAKGPVVAEVAEPRVTGPFDVLVQVAGAGLCRTDLHIADGQLDAAGVTLPMTLGHENAGYVREVGSAVTSVAPGDPVILHPTPTCGVCMACRSGRDMYCTAGSFPGVSADGGMAEWLLTGERACVKLPQHVRPADVAPYADAGITVYHAIRKAVPLLSAGSSVVVVGAGGLGHIAVQCLSVMTPAQILVVDRREEALDLVVELGADQRVLADGTQQQRVMDITGGAGADVVIDLVGEEGAEKEAFGMVRRGGSYFAVGYGGQLDIPTFHLVFNEISVVGNLVGSYMDLVELMELHRAGKVTLHLREYPLDAALDAFADLRGGRLRGRAVLVP